MVQNKYRVTFISPSEMEQRTIMSANSLPDLIRKVESIIADPNGYFVNDKKNNCYFKVIKENVTFIQYELLFSNREIHIEKLKHVAPAILKKLFQKINDPELYVLSLLDVDIATKEYVLATMEPSLRMKVETELAKKWESLPSEIVEAQEVLLEALASFIQE
ncbi:LysR family transcriptional regulator [Bacillus cytotoxicus]